MSGLIAVDTNLLVLLVVGSASEDFIDRHKRTSAYGREDFRLLRTILLEAEGLVLTPHVLAETSNLARQFKRPGVDLIGGVLRGLIERSREVAIPARDAVRRVEFRYLGLTDAALLAVDADDITLLTDDFDLYHASLSAGRKPINFSHRRELWHGL